MHACTHFCLQWRSLRFLHHRHLFRRIALVCQPESCDSHPIFYPLIRPAICLAHALLHCVTFHTKNYFALTLFHSTGLVWSFLAHKLCVSLLLRGLTQSYTPVIFSFAIHTVQNCLRPPPWSKWQTHVAYRSDDIEAQLHVNSSTASDWIWNYSPHISTSDVNVLLPIWTS